MRVFLVIALLSIPSASFASAGRLDLEDMRKLIKGSSVLVLGEVHGDMETKGYYAKLVTEIRRIDPRYDCLGLEFVADQQRAFSAVKDEDTFIDFIVDYLRTVPYYAKQWEQSTPEEKQIAAENFLYQYLPWFKAATPFIKKKEFVFLTDDFSKDGAPDERDYRNRMMAENIRANLLSGKCKKIISINGNAHLMDQYLGTSILRYLPEYKGTAFLLGNLPLPIGADAGLIRLDLKKRTKHSKGRSATLQ